MVEIGSRDPDDYIYLPIDQALEAVEALQLAIPEVKTRHDVSILQHRAITTAEAALGPDHPVLRSLDFRVLAPSVLSVFWRGSQVSTLEITLALNELRLALTARLARPLETSNLNQLLSSNPRIPERGEVDALLTGIGRLEAEVRLASEISESERQDLLRVLTQARNILDHVSDPYVARAEVERLVGRAVASSAHRTPAQPLWRKVAEVVVIAEAAFSLTSGVAGILEHPKPVTVEVTCEAPQLALPSTVTIAPPAEPVEPEAPTTYTG